MARLFFYYMTSNGQNNTVRGKESDSIAAMGQINVTRKSPLLFGKPSGTALAKDQLFPYTIFVRESNETFGRGGLL